MGQDRLNITDETAVTLQTGAFPKQTRGTNNESIQTSRQPAL